MVRSNVFRRLSFVLFSLYLALFSAFPVHAQEPVAISLSISSVTIDTGILIVKGVVTCATPAEAKVHADASEKVGRTLISGSGEVNYIQCNPSGTTIFVRIEAQTGTFSDGRVTVVETASACAPDFAYCLSSGSATLNQTFKVKLTQ